MIVIKLPGEEPISWNILKRMHRMAYQTEVEAVKWRMYQALQETFSEDRAAWPMMRSRVEITMRAFFSGRRLDASNLPIKLYEDGLKGLLIKNDSPVYVAGVHLYSEKATKRNPAGVEITIVEAP